MRNSGSTSDHNKSGERSGKNPFQRLSRGARREQGSLLDFDKSAPGTPKGSTTSSNNSRPSQIDTNHLIQSAAKSIMDESSPGSTDDRSEIRGGFRRHNDHKHNGSSKLSSLETKPYYNSTMQEDEQDRKRFIGCLAAVVASSYEYDVVDEFDDMNEALRLESSVLLDTGDDSTTDEDFPVNNVISGSFEYSDIDGDVEGRPLVHPQQQQQLFGSSSRTTPQRPPMHSANGQRVVASSEKISRDMQKIRLSRSRHRKRRYEVLSNFLMDCGSYLKLEKGQIKAFLPMLSKVLVPQPAPKESSTASSRRNRAMRWASAANRRSSVESNDGSTPASSSAQSDVSSQDSTTQKINILSQIQGTQVDEFSMRAQDIYNGEVDSIEHLRPFLDSMSPGGGFRCLAIVMLEHLLHSSDGYDARVRHALKRLGVLILVHEMESDPGQVEANLLPSFPGESTGSPDLVALATRRFESLEHTIAKKIIELSKHNQELIMKNGGKSNNSRQGQNDENSSAKGSITRDQLIRGLKVGAVGAAAATVFALTGGLAAPGIAAAAAAVAGGTAATAAAAAMLTSTAAVTMIFGVGGGTLVAYKMNRRTQGVTEFEFRKESATDEHGLDDAGGGESLEAELFSTITISGWLRDLCDYQRPWGVSPSNPWISDRVELLQRFYAIYRPENIPKCEQILENWVGEEKDLWLLLKKKYGRDPDSLFPFENGPRKDGSLTLDQSELIDRLIIELGYIPDPSEGKGMNKLKGAWRRRQARYTDAPSQFHEPARKGDHKNSNQQPIDLLSGESASGVGSNAGASTISSIGFESISTHVADSSETNKELPDPEEIPAHLATVWDYSANYGGEHYTVRWESELLTELCDSVADLAFDLVSGGTTQILRHTALSALFSAVAWPYALVNAANMIDGTWTLAVERADEAGRELAKSLLFSNAGHRPVTLVGFSFGARVIYACLKELAKYQEIWCDYQEKVALEADGKRGKDRKESRGGDDSLANMREPAAIVEDAILMGLPNHLSLASWKACRQVVAGRLVNCFSQKDLILSLMFQVKRLKLKAVCGACPIAVSGVENFDVSELIPGHEKYTTQAGEVLKIVRHGQPFRSRPTHAFEIEQPGPEEEPMSADKFDV